jgi:hypothetical protein
MHDNVAMGLLRIRRQVLAYLEEQHAALGIHTPPHIVLEIAQTKREIERLMTHSYIYVLRREVLAHECPAPSPGAILLVSPEEVDVGQPALKQAAYAAIDYHRVALRHCWLIATSGAHGSLGAAEWLANYCRARGITCQVWQVTDASSVEETYQLVQWLYTVAVPASGLSAHDVIVDITGATKPMSIGTLLACQGRVPVQYMVRQEQGPALPLLLPATGPERPPAASEDTT